MLFDAGADVNQATECGWTPLLTAVNNRNYALATLLIERGANVNLANEGGWTVGCAFPLPGRSLNSICVVALCQGAAQ
jgi:hypothetical protein